VEAKVDRFYSRFPVGSVGLALFLLRLADGFGLLSEGIHLVNLAEATTDTTSAALFGVVLMGSAIMLLLGLRTTIAGSAAAVSTAGWVLRGVNPFHPSALAVDAWLFLFAFVFVLSSSLALTGPGGYSLDARLSGWRKINLAAGKSNGPHEWETWS
jgi:uncharacterized membrane protein YphA (DoxX/SURF4 family)